MLNNKSKSFSLPRLIEYLLLIVIIIALAKFTIPQFKNSDYDKDESIAKVNILTNEVDDEYSANENLNKAMNEIENFELDSEGQLKIAQEYDENTEQEDTIEAPKENIQETIQKKEDNIYKTIKNKSETSRAYDPTIPKNMINDNPYTKYVVKAKVLKVGEGVMLPKQENFYNPHTCYTPIKLEIKYELVDLNQERAELPETIVAFIEGGKIKIFNLLESISQEEAKKMGIANLPDEEKEKYIKYEWTNPYYEFQEGNEYAIIINKTNNSLYQVVCGGYGVFVLEKEINENEIYKNVITGKMITMNTL